MRRLALALLMIALATGAVAALASGRDAGTDSRTQQRAESGKRGHHGDRGVHRALHAMVLRSLAGRLEVEPKALRRAVRGIKREQRPAFLAAAGLTSEEVAALRACRRAHFGHGARHGARRGCRGAAARSAIAKLRAYEPDLAALKVTLSESLAGRLGIPPQKVVDGVRAELVQRLDQAARLGLVTGKGKDLAVACFDAPAGCDLQALKAELRHKRGFFRGGHR